VVDDGVNAAIALSRSPLGNLWSTFVFCSPILDLIFPGPETSKCVVVQCKGCGENIPAPFETMPSQPIAARCPLCHEHRRYLPWEVFLGRLSHLMIRKPVTTADGRVGR
jgi:hypothetical protein